MSNSQFCNPGGPKREEWTHLEEGGGGGKPEAQHASCSSSTEIDNKEGIVKRAKVGLLTPAQSASWWSAPPQWWQAATQSYSGSNPRDYQKECVVFPS